MSRGNHWWVLEATRVSRGNHEWVLEGDTSITRSSRVGVGGRNEYFTVITSGCLRVTRVSHGNHESVLEETRVSRGYQEWVLEGDTSITR